MLVGYYQVISLKDGITHIFFAHVSFCGWGLSHVMKRIVGSLRNQWWARHKGLEESRRMNRQEHFAGLKQRAKIVSVVVVRGRQWHEVGAQWSGLRWTPNGAAYCEIPEPSSAFPSQLIRRVP